MNILGFNCYMHDAAACLFRDGQPVAAVEEERFTREKHTGFFPLNAIEWCLDSQGMTAADLDAVTFNMRPRHGILRRIALVASGLPRSLQVANNQGAKWTRMVRAKSTFERLLTPNGMSPGARFHYLFHHHCHAASAFYPSNFDEAAILVWDGSGEIASTVLFHGQGNRLKPLLSVDYPHSVGYLYSAVTQYLGFKAHGGEGKVMGLASYGDDRYHKTFEEMCRLEENGSFRLDLSWFQHYYGEQKFYSNRFVETFGPPRQPEGELTERDMAIAAGVQHATEQIGFHLLRHLSKATGCKRLCVAGGVGLNSMFNGRALEESDFGEIYVQPAAHDAGCSIGGPMLLHYGQLGRPRMHIERQVYLGPSFDDAACEAALKAAGLPCERLEDVSADAAKAVAQGSIIGWFQGAAEYGPRALGNRSIIADPRTAEMKDIVNARVKRREAFRPFAPAVLAEKQAEYFTSGHPSPYMLHILPVRPEKRDVIPAVTHVDGTGRVQTVTDANPPYRRLIEAFEAETGVPVILNTSFNVRGEPIVNTPEEAIACFEGTGLDALYLGPFRSVKVRK